MISFNNFDILEKSTSPADLPSDGEQANNAFSTLFAAFAVAPDAAAETNAPFNAHPENNDASGAPNSPHESEKIDAEALSVAADFVPISVFSNTGTVNQFKPILPVNPPAVKETAALSLSTTLAAKPLTASFDLNLRQKEIVSKFKPLADSNAGSPTAADQTPQSVSAAATNNETVNQAPVKFVATEISSIEPPPHSNVESARSNDFQIKSQPEISSPESRPEIDAGNRSVEAPVNSDVSRKFQILDSGTKFAAADKMPNRQSAEPLNSAQISDFASETDARPTNFGKVKSNSADVFATEAKTEMAQLHINSNERTANDPQKNFQDDYSSVEISKTDLEPKSRSAQSVEGQLTKAVYKHFAPVSEMIAAHETSTVAGEIHPVDTFEYSPAVSEASPVESKTLLIRSAIVDRNALYAAEPNTGNALPTNISRETFAEKSGFISRLQNLIQIVTRSKVTTEIAAPDLQNAPVSEVQQTAGSIESIPSAVEIKVETANAETQVQAADTGTETPMITETEKRAAEAMIQAEAEKSAAAEPQTKTKTEKPAAEILVTTEKEQSVSESRTKTEAKAPAFEIRSESKATVSQNPFAVPAAERAETSTESVERTKPAPQIFARPDAGLIAERQNSAAESFERDPAGEVFVEAFEERILKTETPATARMEDTALHFQKLSEKVFDQIETYLQNRIDVFRGKADKTDSLKLRLRPAELGAVEVRLEKSDAGNLIARFEVESDATRQTIAENLEQLRDSLQKSGWQIERMEIMTALDSSAGKHSRDDQSRQTETAFDRASSQTEFESGSDTRDDSNADRLVSLRA